MKGPFGSHATDAALIAMDAELADHVTRGEIASVDVLLVRHGRPVHRFLHGQLDLGDRAQVRPDAIYRIYSMTKPVTAVAMMLLHEEGRWLLDDPIELHLPEFTRLEGPAGEKLRHRPTMRELLTHGAGFAYGVGMGGLDEAEAAYLAAGVWGSASLSEMVGRVADVPLACQPGTTWRYSLAMDLQGAIIERLSGRSFPDFLRERLFEPLGMADTGFCVAEEKLVRLATLYHKIGAPELIAIPSPLLPADPRDMPALPSGGGGLYSTTADYARFCQMLLGGGVLGDVRILCPKSVQLMMSNQLPDHILAQDIVSSLQRIAPGRGYGFNGAVIHDPAVAGALVGPGTYQWDGAAGCWFWIDSENDLYFVGMIQRVLQEGFPRFQEMTQRHVAHWLTAQDDVEADKIRGGAGE